MELWKTKTFFLIKSFERSEKKIFALHKLCFDLTRLETRNNMKGIGLK